MSRNSRFGSRRVRLIAGTAVVSLAVAGVSLIGGQGAGATAAPRAQSVGRFLDGALGSNPIQEIADVADARASAPGTQSEQNPLDVTLLSALELPLTGALQLPSLAGITLGAANQVAVAQTSGFSYGASGAVNNSGGVSIGGDDASYPAYATIDLSAASLGGGSIAIPGGAPLAALGGVKVTIGAVAALASTPEGGKPAATDYNIADVTIQLGSPALSELLSLLMDATSQGEITGLLGPIVDLLGDAVPAQCSITPEALPTSIALLGGAVVISPATGQIVVDVEALLQALQLDLNNLPANTDLLRYVLEQLPEVLTTGLATVLGDIVDPLLGDFDSCVTALGPSAGVLGELLGTLEDGFATLSDALGDLVARLTDSTSGGMGALTDSLANVIAIGVNVQPNGTPGTFESALAATPNQATAPIAGQTIVRAIEVDLFGGQVAAVSLANAAAGPSTSGPDDDGTPTDETTPPADDDGNGKPNANIPTGVPAGQASGTGTPALPLALLAVGLVMASAGAIAWKVRGVRTH